METLIAADRQQSTKTCRFCGAAVDALFADLGMSPLANAFLTPEQLGRMEPFFPLRALVCERCLLVQLEDYESPDVIFSDYAYFSSYSTTWLEQCRRLVDSAVQRFSLDATSQIVEVASNDGYLLQYFVERGIPALGIDPARNVAAVAEERGVPTLVDFFGTATAREVVKRSPADLLIAINVLPHVPELNDFTAGLKILLRPGGWLVVEFPHLLNLIQQNQFDTIYHEHFSYLSLAFAQRLFSQHHLAIVDVEELPTHGGSLRLYVRHADDAPAEPSDSVKGVLERERTAGLTRLDVYAAFADQVRAAKREILAFFVDRKTRGETIVGYGAAAKGNTLLNYCGIGPDFIDYTVDRSPHKQGRFLPGTHIPIESPDAIARTRPDLVFIFPWNLREEVMAQLAYVREWGGSFAARTGRVEVLK